MDLKYGYFFLILIISIFLASCGNDDGPTIRERDDQLSDFVVVSAKLLSQDDNLPLTAYTIGLTSENGDFLSFKLLTNSLVSPSGKYISSIEQAHGAISELKLAVKNNARNQATDLSINILPAAAGYAFSGLLTLASGQTVKISGSAAIELMPQKRVLIFSSLTSQIEGAAGIALHFTEKDFCLAAEFPTVTLVSELTGKDYALGTNKLTLSLDTPSLPQCTGSNTFGTSVEFKSGTLHTVLNGNVLAAQFNSESFDIAFTLELPDNEQKEETNYVDMPKLLSVSASGADFISVKFAENGVLMNYNDITWQTQYTGSGRFVSLEIYAKDGLLSEGKYAISSEPRPMTFRAGWNPGDIYNIGVEYENWGTCLYEINELGTSISHITDGLVTVSRQGDVYNVKLVSSLISAKFSGEIQKVDLGY